MFPCLVVGDSIAVGVGQVSTCAVHAKVGDSTHQILAKNPGNLPYTLIVISAGSNDVKPSLDEYLALRNKCSGRVVWLLPAKKHVAREFIERIAKERGDTVLDVRPLAGPDGIHPGPAGYKA